MEYEQGLLFWLKKKGKKEKEQRKQAAKNKNMSA